MAIQNKNTSSFSKLVADNCDEDTSEEEIVITTVADAKSTNKNNSFRQQILETYESSDDDDSTNILSNIKSKGLSTISTSMYRGPSKQSSSSSDAKIQEIHSFGETSNPIDTTAAPSTLKSLISTPRITLMPSSEDSSELVHLRELMNTTCIRDGPSQTVSN